MTLSSTFFLRGHMSKCWVTLFFFNVSWKVLRTFYKEKVNVHHTIWFFSFDWTINKNMNRNRCPVTSFLCVTITEYYIYFLSFSCLNKISFFQIILMFSFFLSSVIKTFVLDLFVYWLVSNQQDLQRRWSQREKAIVIFILR